MAFQTTYNLDFADFCLMHVVSYHGYQLVTTVFLITFINLIKPPLKIKGNYNYA